MAIKYRLLTTAQAEDWHALLARLPHNDIYFTPNYHRAYERNGDGEALLFVAEAADALYVHPFVLRPLARIGTQALPHTLYDSTTIYGYGGPLASTPAADFVHRADDVFHDWCQQREIITEFIRFHPLVDNYRLVDNRYTVQFNRETVVMPLSPVADELLSLAAPVHRNRVRKAVKEGLVCREISDEAGLAQFKTVYFHTMQGLNAHPMYYFSEAYFQSLLEDFHTVPHHTGRSARIFGVFYQGDLIAAAIFFFFQDKVHYHLGGSLFEMRHLAPNNLLFHHVALTAAQAGYRQFHLGGGRTAAPDDSLMSFKAKLSPHRARYYTGYRIHDEAMYQSLAQVWLQQRGTAQLPDYFPAYRAPGL
jgi:hypothetical protein